MHLRCIGAHTPVEHPDLRFDLGIQGRIAIRGCTIGHPRGRIVAPLGTGGPPAEHGPVTGSQHSGTQSHPQLIANIYYSGGSRSGQHRSGVMPDRTVHIPGIERRSQCLHIGGYRHPQPIRTRPEDLRSDRRPQPRHGGADGGIVEIGIVEQQCQMVRRQPLDMFGQQQQDLGVPLRQRDSLAVDRQLRLAQPQYL